MFTWPCVVHVLVFLSVWCALCFKWSSRTHLDQSGLAKVLNSLVQLHARSRFRQVVMNLAVSELGTAAFSRLGATFEALDGKGDEGGTPLEIRAVLCRDHAGLHRSKRVARCAQLSGDQLNREAMT